MHNLKWQLLLGLGFFCINRSAKWTRISSLWGRQKIACSYFFFSSGHSLAPEIIVLIIRVASVFLSCQTNVTLFHAVQPAACISLLPWWHVSKHWIKLKKCLKICRQDISQCKMLRQASGWQTQVFIYIKLKEKMLSEQLALPQRWCSSCDRDLQGWFFISGGRLEPRA